MSLLDLFAWIVLIVFVASTVAVIIYLAMLNYETAARGMNPKAYFFMKMDDCCSELRPRLNNSELVQALSNYKPPKNSTKGS